MTVGQTELVELYQDHGGPVFRVAERICGTEIAAEVTQDVFVRLWQRPDAFDSSRGSMRTYLVTAARSRALDAVRSETARRQRQVRSVTQDASSESPEERVIERDVASRLAANIDALPKGERDAVITAFYGQCTYREAALVLGEAEGTVKSRIRSALQRLQRSLTDHGVATEGVEAAIAV